MIVTINRQNWCRKESKLIGIHMNKDYNSVWSCSPRANYITPSTAAENATTDAYSRQFP